MCQATPDALPHWLPTADHYPTFQMSRRLSATRCSFKLKHTDFKQDSWSPSRVPWPLSLSPPGAHSRTLLLCKCQDPTEQTGLLLPEGARGLSKVTQPARHSSELGPQVLASWAAFPAGTCDYGRGTAVRTSQGRPRLGVVPAAPEKEPGDQLTQRPGRGYCGSRSSDAGTTLGAPRGPRIPNSPAAAAESGRRRRTPGSAIPRCPGWGENAAAHFLSNPARRPTSLATASISITLLGLGRRQPTEGRDPVCSGTSQVPCARRHSDPPRSPDFMPGSPVPLRLLL